MKNENKLVVFIKNFELGRVKTRLAKTIGDEKALKVYKHLVDYTILEATSVDTDLTISWSNSSKEISGLNAEFTQQKEGNLGFRMYAAFQEGLATHKKMIIIGSDCPYLKSEHLQGAFQALDNKDLVIGPAEDGGYYLIGMRLAHQELFTRIKWSSESVFEDTVKAAEGLNLRISFLESLNDTDTIDDLQGFLQERPESLLAQNIKASLEEI